MESFAPHIYTFILPLFVGNITHMVIVKLRLFEFLAKPLSAPMFGTGKTYRAFAVMPLLCGISAGFFRYEGMHNTDFAWSFVVGFLLGLTYLVAELPNSFIKRRMGIPAGQSHARYRFLQYIIDKIDSLIPMIIVYYFITGISWPMALLLFGVSFIIHVTFSGLLFLLKVKKSF